MDALDIQNAGFQGVSKYWEWRQKFKTDFQEAMMKGQIKMAFAMIPPQMKEWLKQNDPQGYAHIMSMLEGDKNGNY